MQSVTVIDLSPSEMDAEAVAPGIPVAVGEVTLALLSSSTIVNLQPSFKT